MIEIVEKLIPLVEGATTGAIWLIVGYFILTFMLAVVPTVAVVYSVSQLPRIISSFKGAREISLLDFVKSNTMSCRVKEESLRELIEVISDSSDYLWQSDVDKAIQKLKE